MKVKDYIEIIKSEFILDKDNNIIDIKNPIGNKLIIPYYINGIKSFPREFSGDVVIEEGVNYIYGESFRLCSLKSIIIPGTVKTIGECAFIYCNELEEVIINEGTTIIENSSFYCCKKLKKLTLPNSIKQLMEYSFSETSIEILTIPENLKMIDKGVFESTTIKELIIPETVKQIDSGAFDYCINLEKVTICEGVSCLYDFSFSHCVNLIHVDIPKSLTYVDNKAFEFCLNLDKETRYKLEKINNCISF